MLNKKFIAAGSIALVALAACSSDEPSTAGATVDPNTVSQKIEFTTAATSTTKIDGGEISIFEKESGATSFCIGDEREFTAKIRVDETLRAMKYIEFKKAEGICDSVLTAFKESCPDDIDLDKKECDENGNVEAFCIEQDSTQTYTKRINDFTYESHEICQIIYEGTSTQIFGWQGQVKSSSSTESSSSGESSSSIEPPDTISVIAIPRDTTPIDTAAFTLDKYTAQFTDDPGELSFDEHVLAYNGGLPSTAYLDEDIEQNSTGINPFLKEINVSDIGNYFPMTAAIVGNRTPKENCKTFLVLSHDGEQPTGHVLSKISKGSIEISSVNPGGPCRQTAMYFPIAFLVEDCDGLIDEKASISYKTFTSETWACEEGKYSPTKKASAYGEWYRADLRQ